MDKWVTTKCCLKLGKITTETYEMFQTLYGDKFLSCIGYLNEWFKGRCEDLEDDPRCLSTSQNAYPVANVHKIVAWICLWALRMILDELLINKEIIHQILHEVLWKRKIHAMFVWQRFTDGLKEQLLTSCHVFIQTYKDNSSFLDCIFLFSNVKLPSKKEVSECWIH
jgi:hypothetical protein